MSEQFSEQVDPGAVFSLLGNETRLEILQTLWATDVETVPFSTLYDAVDVDDTGQFNYHLGNLVGQFVAKTEDGYRLTQAGRHVNGAIASGSYTVEGELEPIELDGSCRMCGGSQYLQYDTERVEVECDSCAAGWEGIVPPAVLAGRDREAIPTVVSDHLRTQFRRIAAGFCRYCSGETVPTVQPIAELAVGTEPEEDGPPADQPAVQFECRRCGHRSGLSLDHALLLVEPEVECFFYEHGIHVRETPVWNVPELDPGNAAVIQTDPTRARATFRIDDDELLVTVDEELQVVEIDRRNN
ncbi:hypothetical protein AArcSl_2984 [Halalkaliarchaeum desulfuricum]|uniref:ArsR family transcriptional regulator n=1 Tax=Halalkaliarchaeum desulfuricum TaxID=2055893 RepID=A0A343TNC3_9EURY|nr:helix-turn-helix domain-containing protein [Halalkaliarchaeum desulfuricum]AUX10595.1 hypothetical protein AArcSl_2984 [Halalkaliarchaeum desulfuricum]